VASPTSAQLGAAIRKLRLSRTDLSIEALAAEAGVHRTTLSLIERGHGNPTWDLLLAVADELGVEAIEIVKLAAKMPAKRTRRSARRA
jgi:transcriptional regulator with XRE-family HTH domain